MSQENTASAIVPRIFTMSPGATLGVWVGTTAGLFMSTIQAASGGTVFIIQNPSGQSGGASGPIAASLAAISASYGFWVNPSQPPIPIPGPAAYYLYSNGASALVYVMQYFNNNPVSF